jgi:hypothetical protein
LCTSCHAWKALLNPPKEDVKVINRKKVNMEEDWNNAYTFRDQIEEENNPYYALEHRFKNWEVLVSYSFNHDWNIMYGLFDFSETGLSEKQLHLRIHHWRVRQYAGEGKGNKTTYLGRAFESRLMQQLEIVLLSNAEMTKKRRADKKIIKLTQKFVESECIKLIPTITEEEFQHIRSKHDAIIKMATAEDLLSLKLFIKFLETRIQQNDKLIIFMTNDAFTSFKKRYNFPDQITFSPSPVDEPPSGVFVPLTEQAKSANYPEFGYDDQKQPIHDMPDVGVKKRYCPAEYFANEQIHATDNSLPSTNLPKTKRR